MNSNKLLIGEALFKRGFLIYSTPYGLRLLKGSHDEDKHDLTNLLHKIDIKHHWNNEYLMLDKEIYAQQYEAISFYPARNHETSTPMYFGTWQNFTRRKHGLKIQTIVLESGIAILIKAINAIGITTVNSCDGHGRKQPYIDFASYHNATWFEYLQEEYFGNLDLHYEWEIGIHPNKLAYLAASGKHYVIALLQEDSRKMAEILFKHDQEIRDLKQLYFHKDKKPIARVLKGKDYEETKGILRDIISRHKGVTNS